VSEVKHFENMAAANAAAAAPVANQRAPTGRSWCFTWNNPTTHVLFPDGLPQNIKYIVYQLEKGEQGTTHLQGFIQFSATQRLSAIKKIEFKTAEGATIKPFEGAHLEIAKGNAEQNKAYCTKSETRLEGPWELGTIPTQGDRTDLKAAAMELMASGDIRKIDPAVFLKYASGCLKLAALAPPPRRNNLKVISIIGKTGIGKSWSVHDLYPDVYVVNMGNSGLWWDGYTDQKVVLFEEFKGQVQLQKLLQILDPYPLRLEIKGGLVPARFTLVFITSNYQPSEWYHNEQGLRDPEMAALARRLDNSGAVAGPKFIYTDNRVELHQKLDLALQIADLEPKPDHKISGPQPLKAPAIVVAAAAAPLMVPPRSKTPIIITDDEMLQAEEQIHCTLKRQRATLGLRTPADKETPNAMMDENGDWYVREELMPQYNAPKPL